MAAEQAEAAAGVGEGKEADGGGGEIEAKIRCLREDEAAFVGRIERDYSQQGGAERRMLQREAEGNEAKLVEAFDAAST